MALQKPDHGMDEYEMFSELRRTRDPELREKIIDSYIYIAEILSRRFINRGIEYEDIYQVACMGIIYAVDRFDPDRDVKFATYATPTVLGEIRKYFRDKGNFIKVPRTLYDVFYRAERIRRAETHSMTNDELARILNLPREVIDEAYEAGGRAFIQSLEYEACADGYTSLSNYLGREDKSFMAIEDREFLRCCMEKLTDREKEFIQLRYEKELSQKRIAAKWGVSQMYISRLEKKILKKLRGMYFRD